jgi:hypothetical protein
MSIYATQPLLIDTYIPKDMPHTVYLQIMRKQSYEPWIARIGFVPYRGYKEFEIDKTMFHVFKKYTLYWHDIPLNDELIRRLHFLKVRRDVMSKIVSWLDSVIEGYKLLEGD